jgi:hypothetical protein
MRKYFKTSLLLAATMALVFTGCSEKKPEVESIALNKSTITLSIGSNETLTATVTPSGAATVAWTSSNNAVATVNNGVVSAVSAGSAVITAKAGEKSATCNVTVLPAGTANVTVTFGSESWTATSATATYYSSYDILDFWAFQTDNTTYPYLNLGFTPAAGDIIFDGSSSWFEYYEATTLIDSQDIAYGDWWADYEGNPSPKFTVTNYANGKISGNATVTMFNAKEKLVDQNPNFATRTLTLTVVDLPVVTQ